MQTALLSLTCLACIPIGIKLEEARARKDQMSLLSLTLEHGIVNGIVKWGNR